MKRTLLLFASATILSVAGQAQTARVQVIHNSPDAAADSVDVYVNGTLLLDNLAFRTATPFVDVPSGLPLQIAVAPKSSTSATQAVYNTTATLTSGERYIITAAGLVSPSGYTPGTTQRPFRLAVFAGAREMATQMNQTDVLVMHGSTDAPTVDIASAGNVLVDNVRFGDYSAGYLNLPLADYSVQVRDSANTTTVASYTAPLQLLNLGGASLTVLASGFLTPASNSNGAAFGLFAVPATGGAFIPLPVEPLSVRTANASTVALALAPNPAAEKLSVQHSLTGRVDFALLDATGRQLRAGTLSQNDLSVADLAPGTYLLQLRSADAVSVGRFVKQ